MGRSICCTLLIVDHVGSAPRGVVLAVGVDVGFEKEPAVMPARLHSANIRVRVRRAFRDRIRCRGIPRCDGFVVRIRRIDRTQSEGRTRRVRGEHGRAAFSAVPN